MTLVSDQLKKSLSRNQVDKSKWVCYPHLGGTDRRLLSELRSPLSSPFKVQGCEELHRKGVEREVTKNYPKGTPTPWLCESTVPSRIYCLGNGERTSQGKWMLKQDNYLPSLSSGREKLRLGHHFLFLSTCKIKGGEEPVCKEVSRDRHLSCHDLSPVATAQGCRDGQW